VQRHPWKGTASCEAATAYRNELPLRFAREARNLEDLTGWAHSDVAARMEATGQPLEVK
jgi:hypothetical protein